MPNDYFQFKQFTIRQEKCAMKVGTDGVLLGAWANLPDLPGFKVSKILDIGTGTGLIALMLAQRTKAQITGIEIDSNAAKQATINVADSKWKDRINIVNQDLLQYAKQTEDKFDLIVSNPPYFEHALHSPQKERTIARHTKNLNYESLIQSISQLLNDIGIFSLIVPAEFENKIDTICFENNLFANRICYVKPTPTKIPKRILIEFSRIKKPISKSELIIETGIRHEYSKEYIALSKDYYLNM